ncbi:Uncharacterised protein [Collinsella sp. AK_207A]|nr:Uncharacterised protein [Collinsella sp. AK_207A]
MCRSRRNALAPLLVLPAGRWPIGMSLGKRLSAHIAAPWVLSLVLRLIALIAFGLIGA